MGSSLHLGWGQYLQWFTGELKQENVRNCMCSVFFQAVYSGLVKTKSGDYQIHTVPELVATWLWP